eukprot:m51a1_g11039 hypothetical protein (1089) ;mRNA; f:439373-443063
MASPRTVYMSSYKTAALAGSLSSTASQGSPVMGTAAAPDIPPPSASRTYTTKRGKQYAGPAVPPLEPEVVNQCARHRYPAYVAPDGALYDVNYGPYAPAAAPAQPSDAAAEVYDVGELAGRLPAVATRGAAALEPAPEPERFESYDEYEGALLAWAAGTQRALGYAAAPSVCGRHYSRPSTAGDATRRKESITDEIVAKAATADDGERALDEWLLPLKEDPWDAALVPPQPRAQFYEDFEQYEAAMRRWAIECAKMARMPPAVWQLPDVSECPIKPAKAPSATPAVAVQGLDQRSAGAVVQAQQAVRPPFVSPHILVVRATPPLARLALKRQLPEQRTPAPMRLKIVESSWLPKAVHRWSPEQPSRLSADTQRKLSTQLGLSGSSWNEPLTPPFKADLTELRALTKLDWGRAQSALGDPLGSKYAREVREDYEMYEQGGLAQSLEVTDAELDARPELADLYSKAEAQASLIFRRVPVEFNDILRLARSQLHLSQFKRLLENGNAKQQGPWFKPLAAVVTSSNFPELVQAWGNAQDPTVLAKLSYFITRVFRGSYSLLTPLKDSQDCATLYTLARCTHYAQGLRYDIFPFSDEVMPTLSLALKGDKAALAFASQVFVMYYAKIIGLAQGGDGHMQATAHSLEEQLGEALRSTSGRALGPLFDGIRHRNALASGVCLFAVLQLANSQVPSVQASLRSADAKLVENLRLMSSSKFTHTRFACRRLLEVMLGDAWRGFFLDSYVNTALVWDDLLKSTSPRESVAMARKACVFALSLAVDENSADTVWGVFCEGHFFSAIQALLRSSKSPGYQTEAIAAVLCRMCKKAWELKFVQPRSEKLKTSFMGRRTMHVLEIPVSDRETAMILATIANLSSHDKSPETRGVVLAMLRVLMRHKGVFDIVRSDANLAFFSKLVGWCKDEKSRMLNKNAWRLLHELLDYHAGVIEMLDKSKLLTQFTDIISPEHEGAVVMTNSLHYLGKLFTMSLSEQKRTLIGLPLRRDDGKSIDKDQKHLASFFKERMLFVKLHMMYTRMSLQGSYGAAFQQLAKVFYLLMTVPECQKLLKDIMKRDEYRVGLQRVYEMYTAQKGFSLS